VARARKAQQVRRVKLVQQGLLVKLDQRGRMGTRVHKGYKAPTDRLGQVVNLESPETQDHKDLMDKMAMLDLLVQVDRPVHKVIPVLQDRLDKLVR